jgi:hypothetical protein
MKEIRSGEATPPRTPLPGKAMPSGAIGHAERSEATGHAERNEASILMPLQKVEGEKTVEDEKAKDEKMDSSLRSE